MKLFLVLIALLFGVSACGQGGAQPGDISVTAQPPTGPGISQNSPVADITTQLLSMRFVPPDKNATGKWWRPEDSTTAEVGANNQITLVFKREDGSVTCTVPAESFGAEIVRLEQLTTRAALLKEPSCS